MADSILKLKVETSEYDQKLANAAKGIRHLADVAHQSAGDMTGLTKAELDYIKSLGTMETKSRTAAGSVRELESTFKELTVVYNNLNEVEKNDEGGKALRASLDQIKQRAQEAKAQLDTASKSLNDNGQSAQQSGGILESLAGKFTLNIDALKLFDMGLSAAKAALDVAKDAFFASEGNIDEWGRTVKGAEGAYDVFLETLNNGNWSNFFSNLQTAIQGARDLYDSLDRLGSIKSNNQAAIAIQQQQVQQLRLMKQQGQNVDDQLKAATQRLAQLQQQAVNAGKQAGSQMIGNTIRNGYNSQDGAGKITGASVDAAVRDIVTHGQAAFDRYAKTVNQFESDRSNYKTVTRSDMDGNRFTEQVFDISKLTKEQQKQYNLAKTITDRETEIQKGITLYAQAVNEGAAAAREELKGNRYALQGSGGSGGKGGKTTKEDIKYADDSIMAQEKLISDLTQKWKTASGELRDGYLKQLDEAKAKLKEMTADPLKELEEGFESNFETGSVSPAQAFIDRIRGDLAQANLDQDMATFSQIMTSALKGGIDDTDLSGISEDLFRRMLDGENIPDEVWDELKEYIQEQIPGLFPSAESGSGNGSNNNSDKKNNPLLHTDENGKQYVKANELLGSISSGMSSVVRGLEQLGVDIPEEIKGVLGGMQSISTILTGIATTVIAIQALSAADFFKPFANGGTVGRAAGGMFIPGNSFSGDRLRMPVDGGSSMIGVNSGELILNRAQQGIIAQELEGGAQQGGAPQVRLEGEEIWIALNNYTSRTGYGEVLTSKA